MSQFASNVGLSAPRTVCQNHPEAAASDRCAGCAEAFCHNCIVEMQGQKYCGQCKVMGLRAQPMLALANIPCQAAKAAMGLALGGIVGMFCFGAFGCLAGLGVEITAIVKAVQARRMIARDPRLTGGEKATFALVLGIIMVAMHALLLVGLAAGAAREM